MSAPGVTLVMPSYNQAAFVEAAIESVLAQDYPRLELVVADGGSSDGTVDIVRRHEDRLAWWTSGPDGGQPAALNAAFARAEGELLGWLNSDDVLLPGAVAAAVAALGADDGALLAYGDNRLIDASGRDLGPLPGRDLDLVEAVRTWQNPVPQPGSMFSRRAYELAGPLDEDSPYYFDFAFVLRLALTAGRLVRVERALAGYRLHGESKSMSGHVMKAEDHVRLAERLFARPDLPAGVRAIEAEAMRRSHLTAAAYFHEAFDRRRTRRSALRALAAAPGRPSATALAFAAKSLLPSGVVRALRSLRRRWRLARSGRGSRAPYAPT